MKTYQLTVFAIALCLLAVTSAFTQTKQETIDWLNSKFNKNPIVYGEYFKSAQRMKINSDGTFEITNLSFEVQPTDINRKVESTTVLKGSFKDFSPSSVTVSKKEGYVFILMNCFNGKGCVSISQTGENLHHFENDGVQFGAFYSEESNIAERLKKAFIHLINLCGGKKEAF